MSGSERRTSNCSCRWSIPLPMFSSSSCRELPVNLRWKPGADRPVIGFEVGGIPELIGNGRTGFVVPLKDQGHYTTKSRKSSLIRSVAQKWRPQPPTGRVAHPPSKPWAATIAILTRKCARIDRMNPANAQDTLWPLMSIVTPSYKPGTFHRGDDCLHSVPRLPASSGPGN